MIYLLPALGLAFFIVPLWAYRKGLKDGLAIQRGGQPEPIQTPREIYEARQAKQEAKTINDKIAQGWANMMAYTGDPQAQPKEGEK